MYFPENVKGNQMVFVVLTDLLGLMKGQKKGKQKFFGASRGQSARGTW